MVSTTVTMELSHVYLELSHLFPMLLRSDTVLAAPYCNCCCATPQLRVIPQEVAGYLPTHVLKIKITDPLTSSSKYIHVARSTLATLHVAWLFRTHTQSRRDYWITVATFGSRLYVRLFWLDEQLGRKPFFSFSLSVWWILVGLLVSSFLLGHFRMRLCLVCVSLWNIGIL